MRAVIVGAVESTRIALRAAGQAPGWQAVGLLTLPQALAHRHSDFVDLREDAAEAGISAICWDNTNSDAALRYLSDLKPDYVFVIGSSQLCGEAFLNCAPGRVIGYHPAPLPRLRGRGVIPWTILLNEPITASTLFKMDLGTDTGAIVEQRFFHVRPDETAASLYAHHMEVLGAMLPDVLARLAIGNLVAQPQDEAYATYAARRRPEDGEIDWNQPAADVWRMVRACGEPYPGAYTTLRDEALVIDEAKIVTLDRYRAAFPGQIVARGLDDFTVCCGDDQGLRVFRWRWTQERMPPLHIRLGFGSRKVS